MKSFLFLFLFLFLFNLPGCAARVGEKD